MDESHVVTCFLRHRASVLLLERSEAVGSYSGLWGGVSGYAEGTPDEQAHREIEEETGLDADVRFVRGGEPLSVTDEQYDSEWIVHPYLFDCDSRAVAPNEEIAAYEWVSPAEIHRRETVPGLWTAYERVAPTVDTIAGDTEHGAEYLSLRALEVLRDAAAVATHRDTERSLTALAHRLRTARPNMSVVANRIDRAMYDAESDAGSVLAVTERAIERVRSARETVAVAGVDRLPDDPTVLTLSRSGTVRRVLERGDNWTVYVATSRPGGEGTAVAESLTATADVVVFPDAAVAHALSVADVDAVLVGADTVLADGRVVNKVGTRAAALAAAHEGIEVYAVTTEDKIQRMDEGASENGAPESSVDLGGEESAVYAGTADVDVLAPTFDVTPADRVTVVTENGPQSVADIERIAQRHREYATWDR